MRARTDGTGGNQDDRKEQRADLQKLLQLQKREQDEIHGEVSHLVARRCAADRSSRRSAPDARGPRLPRFRSDVCNGPATGAHWPERAGSRSPQ